MISHDLLMSSLGIECLQRHLRLAFWHRRAMPFLMFPMLVSKGYFMR